MSTNVALYGRSGSGKSTVAAMISEFGYHHLRTGRACRKICEDLFQSQAKGLMNQVTDALREIDPDVWLRVALREVDGGPVVLDSMRFHRDYAYLRGRGFHLVKVEAVDAVRRPRLVARGQEFDAVVDEVHPAEAELSGAAFDSTIVNNGDMDDLRVQVRRTGSMRHSSDRR